MKLKKLIKKYWHWPALLFVSLAFAAAAAAFNFHTQNYADSGDFVKWASPDETANYIFAKLYGQTGQLKIEENYNLYTDDIMRPRSFRSDHGSMKPVSFLGIILVFGTIVKYTTYKILPFLTPIFAGLGIIFYYLLIKRIFGRVNALISAILLAGFPVYLYFTARSMFHNVLFTVFLIISLYFMSLFNAGKQKKTRAVKDFFKLKIGSAVLSWLWAGLAGIFFGLAAITRSSELLWLLPLLLILFVFNIRTLGITKPVIFISFLFLAMLPVFSANIILYDSPYLGGYAEMNSSIITIKNAGIDILKSAARQEGGFIKELSRKIFDTVFYFGFHPRESLKMFYSYVIKMFPVLFWGSVLGLALFFIKNKKIKKRQVAFMSGWLCVSAILVFYYGSWEFHDNPDPSQTTIGNSYTRYWLPVYLGMIPFLSIFIIKLSRAVCYYLRRGNKNKGQLDLFSGRTDKRLCLFALRSFIIIPILFFSTTFVLSGSDEGLIYLAQRQRDAKYEWSRILELTENNSTIITRYHDKLLFPERKVIVGLFDDKEMVLRYAKLAELLPVYYYNFTLGADDIDYLNARRLGEAGLEMIEIAKITSDFTLYRLKLVE